jgi:hypothetical protein
MGENLSIDSQRGRKAVEILLSESKDSGQFLKTEMPEDSLPAGIRQGSLEHILFITLTVSIDYQRDSNSLWESARITYGDPETSYLFIPAMLLGKSLETIIRDMQKYKLSKKPRRDAIIWRTVALSFLKEWQGDPRDFLRDCEWDAIRILARLKSDKHIVQGRQANDYPYLRGNKIGPLWVRMLRDNIGISHFKNLDCVPIPIDTHVARASLALGVVRGEYTGPLDPLFEKIREVWFASTQGLRFGQREMVALDMDKPLWNLSKYGCATRSAEGRGCRHKHDCPVHELCVSGKIAIKNTIVEVDT